VPVSALLLTLAAAVLHAGWNVLLAGRSDVRAATTVTLALSVVAFAPVAAATWRVEAAAVPWIAASAALELAYFLLLVAAYSRSDVSLVYPVARGTAPALVLAAAVAVGAAGGRREAAGVVLVGAGVLLVRGVGGRADSRGIALALTIGAVIAGYTLVDNSGIEHASPIAYLELVLLPVAAAALALELRAGRARALRDALGPATAAAAAASFGAYALVLAALELAPAAPVAAVRESSILVAAALGALVLGERVSKARLGGAALIVTGVVLVTLA
jgi:drug/metabolite transporter (DMT)-like permease